MKTKEMPQSKRLTLDQELEVRKKLIEQAGRLRREEYQYGVHISWEILAILYNVYHDVTRETK